MCNKYYTVEWIVDLDERYYNDFKRFEVNEEEKMDKFIFDLAHKEGISQIWKNTFEKIVF